MQILNFKQDQQIIKRIKANDKEILGELFIKYEKMVSHYVLTHGGNNDDAEDMLQEAIIVLWQRVNADRFEVKSKIGTFIFGVVKNKWMSETRKKIRNKNIDEMKDLESEDKTEEKIVSKDQLEIIDKAMNKLSDICRNILNLFYFEERSMVEIAGLLDLANVNVAKSKKYQCKKSLIEILDGTGVFNGL